MVKRPEMPESTFPTAEEDVCAARLTPDNVHTSSPSYRLAYADEEFMLRDELRPVRLQLELLKPDLLQKKHGIHSTIVIFGSSRILDKKTATEELQKAEAQARGNPSDPALARRVRIANRIFRNIRYYDEAQKLAHLITADSRRCELVVVTGGGPGIMEAANRGAADAGGVSIGLNIVLPLEQQPNSYITPELCFQFHYFAIRKMHFLLRARALVAFPGGFGTLDELFETLTLIQMQKIKPVPVLLLGREYWQRIINFEAMVEEGTIDEEHLALFEFVDSAEEAWRIIKAYYKL
jgi:uncharacterized protein (TIGR00730 family)